MGLRELHRIDGIGGVGAADDRRGVPIERAIPDVPSLFVTIVAAQQQRSMQTRAKFFDFGTREQQLLAGSRQDGQIVGGRGTRAERETRGSDSRDGALSKRQPSTDRFMRSMAASLLAK